MEDSQNQSGFFLSVIKGGLTALITTLIAVLIFAGVIKSASLGTWVIKAVNQFIKVLSVFLGCFFCVKQGKGLIKGVLIGVLSCMLTALVFVLVCGNEISLSSFLIDLGFLAVIGAVCGATTVNVKRT